MMRFINKLRGRPSCEEIMAVLQSYLDGEIDAETARKVAGHLDDCTECDRESQVYQTIKASLASRRREVDPEILAALRLFGQQLESAD
ncbi:MAG: zf-HC2 domain-containing protein [Acidimicrobiales bacterium]